MSLINCADCGKEIDTDQEETYRDSDEDMICRDCFEDLTGSEV